MQLPDFEALPDWERDEYLAYDQHRQNEIARIMGMVRDEKIKLWDGGTIATLLLALMEG